MIYPYITGTPSVKCLFFSTLSWLNSGRVVAVIVESDHLRLGTAVLCACAESPRISLNLDD